MMTKKIGPTKLNTFHDDNHSKNWEPRNPFPTFFGKNTEKKTKFRKLTE